MWSSVLSLRNISVATMYSSWLITRDPTVLCCANLGSLTIALDAIGHYAVRRIKSMNLDVYNKQVMIMAVETVPRMASICWYKLCAAGISQFSMINSWMWYAHGFANAAFWIDVGYCSVILWSVCISELIRAQAQPHLTRAFDVFSGAIIQLVQAIQAIQANVPPVTNRVVDQNTSVLTAEEAAQQDDICAICHDSLAPRRILTCNHVFHAGCLEEWATHHSGTCPTCRARIDITE